MRNKFVQHLRVCLAILSIADGVVVHSSYAYAGRQNHFDVMNIAIAEVIRETVSSPIHFPAFSERHSFL